jgi:hypothetical protein
MTHDELIENLEEAVSALEKQRADNRGAFAGSYVKGQGHMGGANRSTVRLAMALESFSRRLREIQVI